MTATYLVIHTPTGDALTRNPVSESDARRLHAENRGVSAIVEADDSRLAHSESRGYYVPVSPSASYLSAVAPGEMPDELLSDDE